MFASAAAPAFADVPPSLAAYVRARAADAAGNSVAATAGYRAALANAPGSPVVAMRAYREALTAGDMALARSAAATLESAGVAPHDSVLLAVADAIRNRRWQSADAAADRLATGSVDFLAPVIKAWVAFDRGGVGPQAILDIDAKSALARRFNLENHALLLIAGGDVDQAMAQLLPLVGASTANAHFRVTAAQLLARRGKVEAAKALIVGADPELTAIRDRLGRGAKPSATFGVSRLFVRLAADLVEGDAKPLAIALCRAAIEIDPADDRARLTLAGALSNDGAHDRALEVLDNIGARSPYAATAKAMAITLLSRSGEQERALVAAQAIVSTKGANADDFQRLGDLLVAAGRQADAATAYAAAMGRGGADDWTLNVQRGGALEQAGRWHEALPFLKRAVDLAPQEAHALNYLGYAQVERGENLDAARMLLERAAALQPDDPSVTDSLGWVYFRLKRVAQALPLLERAARGEPGDATINEHLGDAYWSLGRRYEARYAWRAASVYADGGEAVRLAGKLASGLLP